MLIKESQISASKDDPKQVLHYAIRQINIAESKKYMTVFARNKDAYKIIFSHLKKLFSIVETSNNIRFPFKTSCHTSNYSFRTEGNIMAALEFFKLSSCLSEITFNEAVLFLNKKSAEKQESNRSQMFLYD